MLFSGVHTDYFMLKPPACPGCKTTVTEKTLVESVRKTSRCIVIDEGYYRYGITGEIASVIAEGAFYDLDGPGRRIGARHVPIPFSPPLEDATVPTERDVFTMARQMCNK